MYHPLVSILLLACLCTGQPIGPDMCGTGDYKLIPSSGHPVCEPCTEGKTYMSENNHNNTQCNDCTPIKDPNLEIVHRACNKVNNTVIVCIPGYFRNTENDTCVLCQSCNYTGRQCQNFSNSVCCPGDNYNVIDGACEIFCTAGEYLSEEKCWPCKDGYFNSNPAHRNASCTPCQEPDHLLHLEVKEACNKTHNAKLGCMRNYYMIKSGSHLIPDECENCGNCLVFDMYVGRNCSDTDNTVCCQKPAMTVTDSGVCEENVAYDTTTASATTAAPGSIITCSKGHYLHIDSKDTNKSCMPCRHGTFQDKDNNTDTQCKNCTVYKGSQVPETCLAQDHGNTGLSHGQIVAIVLGILVSVVVSIIICIIYVYKRRRQEQQIITSNNNNESMGLNILNVHNDIVHEDINETDSLTRDSAS